MNKTGFETLRSIPEIQSVPDLQLNWFLENSHRQVLLERDFLFKPLTSDDRLFIVLDGVLDLFIFQGETRRTLFQYQKGGILGCLPFSNNTESTSFCQASLPTEILSFPKSDFRELILHCPELTEALVQLMLSRKQSFSYQTLQDEKMLTLGKLTAGLSHELNHPITAIQRDNSELNRVFLKGNLNKLVSSCTGLEAGEKLRLQEAISVWKRSGGAPAATSKEIQKSEKDWLKKTKGMGNGGS